MSETRHAANRLIVGLVSIAIRLPWLTVLVMLAITASGLYYISDPENLEINTNTADMISSELDWRQDFNAYREGFPARDRNIVAVVDGADAEQVRAYALDFVAALAAEPELFPTVFLEGEGDFFARNGMLYLPTAELEALVDRLIEAQPLLGRLARDASGAAIVDVIGEALTRRNELGPGLAEELDQIAVELEQTIAAAAGNESRAIAWGSLLGVAADSSTRRLILIRPYLDFSLVRPAREAIDTIRTIEQELAAIHGDQVGVRLTGTLAMEHEELTSVTQSAQAAGIASLLMVIVVLLWALRSVRLLIVAVVTLLSGLILTGTFAAVTVGELNLLSVAFAVLYVGLGVDFILHLGLRLKELGGEGMKLKPALLETAGGVGSSLLICAVTTAVGFFAFIPTDFVGISDLGLISGGGMIISLIVSLTLLPAMVAVLRAHSSLPKVRPAGKPRRIVWRSLPPRATCGLAALVVLLALFQLPSLEFDGNPIHLRDPDAESIQALEDLANDSDAPLFDLAIMVPDAAAAEEQAARLQSLQTVARVRTVASLVPAEQDDKLFLLEDLDFALGSTLAEFGDSQLTSSAERLAESLAGLAGALGAIQSRSAEQDRLLASIGRWQQRWNGLQAEQRAASAGQLDADLQGNLIDQIDRLNLALEAEAFGLQDLPTVITDRWLNESGQQLVEVAPAENLNDNEASRRFVADVRSVAPNATGLPVVYQEAAATVTRSFALALVYAFIAVSLLLLLFLRSLRDALLVLIPIVFAAVVTAALSAALGLPLNFANIIALPLLVGVGVDSGIHMVHRMRTEPPRDGDPLHTSTSRAVLASALTTIASFGNLAFATHVGMASMGQLLTLGMVMSLVAVLGLLPALMRSWRTA